MEGLQMVLPIGPPPVLYAYEIDWFGADQTSWEVWDGDIVGDEMLTTVESENFGDWIDFVRGCGYDVHINTLESWEALNASE